jgi:hypothetical protein
LGAGRKVFIRDLSRLLGEVISRLQITADKTHLACDIAHLTSEVLDAQRQQFNAEIDLSDSQRTHLLAVIDLYRALGGGWSDARSGN